MWTLAYRFWLENAILRAPENDGGGGADPGGADGADGGDADPGGADGADGGDADPGGADGADGADAQRPDWAPELVPDHMLGKTEAETLANVAKAVDGYRKADSERGVVPKQPQEYSFEAGEKLEPYMAGFHTDPLYQGVLEDAQAAGLTDKQFGKFMPSLLTRLLDSPDFQAPADFNTEIDKLAPQDQSLDPAEKKAAASRRIGDALSWIDGAKAQGLDAEIADYLVAQIGDDARGIQAIEYFRSLTQKTNPAMNGRAGEMQTRDQIQKRHGDPRADPDNPQYDPKFVDETAKMYRDLDEKGAL